MVKTKDILKNLLFGYNKITPDESVEIQKIIDKFPYFQQAYLLQTKFLKQSHSYYKNILQETAARTTDRRRLYEIIEWELQKTEVNISTGKTDTDIPQKTESSSLEHKPEEQTAEDTGNIEDESFIVQVKEKNNAPKEMIKPETDLINSGTKFIEEIHPETKEKKDEIQIFITEEELSKKNKTKKKIEDEEKTSLTIMDEAKNQKLLITKSEGGKKKNTNEQTTKPDIITHDIKDYSEEESVKDDVKTEDTESKQSYLEWLRQLNAEKKLENSQIFDAIDKFLKERPKIIPKREKSVEPPAIIEKSIEERQTLMTETLANLYIKQKKYHKAIQAFKILSLKYPKKSSYFANRIKELKQKLK